MSLPWIRLDTAIGDHPKVLALIDAKKHKAAFVYILGLTYSGRHELDGYVPKAALPFLHATKADADSLVAVGLWRATNGGWDINGWAEYQVSGDESKKRRQNAQAAALKRWHKDEERA